MKELSMTVISFPANNPNIIKSLVIVNMFSFKQLELSVICTVILQNLSN